MRTPPAFAHLPRGFYLGGLLSITFGTGMLLAAIAITAGPAEAWEHYAARGVFVLLASLGLINAEALWTPRPWAYRTSVALAASCTAVAAGLVVVAPSVWMVVAAVYALSAAVVIPFLRHLRAQTRPPAPQGRVRVPAPRP